MSFNVDGLHIGYADIYMGTSAPSTGTTYPVPVTVTASGVPTNIGTATYIGYTEGEAKLSYKPSYQEIEVEQALSAIGQFVSKEEATLSFTCKQATAQNLSMAIGQGVLTDIPGTPAVSQIQVGGYRAVSTKPFVLVSRIDETNDFYIACFYSGFSADGLDIAFNKNKETTIPVTIKGFSDITRRRSDQLFQLIVQETT